MSELSADITAVIASLAPGEVVSYGDIAHDWTARFVIDNALDGLSFLPGVSVEGGPARDYFLHLESGSFAAVSGSAADGEVTVRQGGPVRVWDVVERAVGDRHAVGEPGVTEFGIRVTPETHTVYVRSAPNVRWVRPASPR